MSTDGTMALPRPVRVTTVGGREVRVDREVSVRCAWADGAAVPRLR
jgi:hypothetical protein